MNSPSQPPTVTAPATESVSDSSSLVFSTAKGGRDRRHRSRGGKHDGRNRAHGHPRDSEAGHDERREGRFGGQQIRFDDDQRHARQPQRGPQRPDLHADLPFSGAATIAVSLKDSADRLTGSATIDVTVDRVGLAVQVAAVEEIGNVHAPSTPVPNVDQAPVETGTTTPAANAPSGGLTINFATPDRNGVPAAPEAAVDPAALPMPAGPIAIDDVRQSSIPTNAGSSSAGPASTHDGSLIDEAVQRLGLSAALEFLNP